MNFTPEQLQKAERVHFLFGIAGNAEAEAEKDALFESLEKELGEKGLDRLLDHVEASVKEEDPLSSSQAAAPGEAYDLLPFEVYDPKLKKVVPAPGYAIDQHCRPHGVGGRQRKRGPLSHQHGWVKRKGGNRSSSTATT